MQSHPSTLVEGAGCRASAVGGGRPTDHGSEPKLVPLEDKLVNAAFLLVTTAWIAGADAKVDAKAPATPPAPMVATPVYSVGTGGCGAGGCGGCGCDSCGCESGGLLSKLRARFHRGNDCGCESSASHFGGRGHKSDCGCDSGCGGCDSG